METRTTCSSCDQYFVFIVYALSSFLFSKFHLFNSLRLGLDSISRFWFLYKLVWWAWIHAFNKIRDWEVYKCKRFWVIVLEYVNPSCSTRLERSIERCRQKGWSIKIKGEDNHDWDILQCDYLEPRW